jgi:mRNA interferase MazF
LIIQDDLFANTSSVTCIPLTTTALDAPLLRVPIAATTANGLTKDSWVMIDKLTTVRRDNLGHHLGRISAAELVTIERLIAVFLGLAT